MNKPGLPIQIQLVGKRAMDITLSILGLALLSPILALIAVAVKLDSPGPVLFSHTRIGKNGKPFTLYKFRSMAWQGDEQGYLEYLRLLIESERTGPAGGLPYRKMDHDPRLTRVGAVLRAYYLDELPQLWNVARGEMSLVGPRPHVPLEVAYYTPDQMRRLSVRPGMTGPWQAAGKAELTFNQLIASDLAYIDGWNIWRDLSCLFTTLALIARGGTGWRPKFLSAEKEGIARNSETAPN